MAYPPQVNPNPFSLTPLILNRRTYVSLLYATFAAARLHKILIAAHLKVNGVSTRLAHWYRDPVLRRLTPPFHNSTRAQEIREPLSCINKVFGIPSLRKHACDLAPSTGQAKAGKGAGDDFLSGHWLNP